MAYAERRGNYWRVRYKRPDGTFDSASGFESKTEALDFGEEQEVDIRRNVWQDPHAGALSLADWINQWWGSQDLSPRTVDRYDYLIRHHLLPNFGARPLNTFIDHGEIVAWEKRTAGRGFAWRTAKDARSLLSLLLSDARPRIQVNVAARPNGRGRRSGRRRRGARTPQRAWGTPLEVLLTAERAAALTGRDDDFVLVVTLGWTAMRWGEVIGLQPAAVRPDSVCVDYQLGELKGAFELAPPKDDSYRNDDPVTCGPVDLPPFLSELLMEQAGKARRCICRSRSCGGDRYLFLGPRGGHYGRSTFNRRQWHPAVDGAYPKEGGKRPRPARPVLVDVSAGFPGVPVLPAWPYADGPDWSPPRGHGRTRLDQPDVDASKVPCPRCGAPIGGPCRSRTGRPTADHRGRVAAAAGEWTRARALASWLPIKALVPHGTRHSHKVWMIEDGIPEVAQEDRLGHQMEGISGTYAHVSDAMRDQIKQALQRRWETALDARAKLGPTSPVGVLNELLAARATPSTEDDLPILSH